MSDEGLSGVPPGTTRARGGAAAALAGFVVAIVAMMIVPLPTPLLDVLITLNLAFAVALLLLAVYSTRTLELSTFPTLLVLTTLYRLSLNVSTVRLILLQADAGRVVRAFGSFVVRGDYVVGFAVFLILTIVQYIVISRGAERVAEVAARFTLDAMPGAQLAIDAELRSGALSAQEARRRRGALGREAQLYGALDGAMRFVKGDALAGLLILGISLVGGLVIGVMKRGLGLGEAGRLYSLLTIGDGLVSQLPALLISTAAGLVVTRVASPDSDGASPGAGSGASSGPGAGELGPELARQLLRPRALGVTALLLAVLALVPGLPLVPFALVAAGAGGLAFWARRRQPAAEQPEAAVPEPPPTLEVAVDPQLSAATPGLPARLAETARAVASDLGLLVPPVETRVDARLPLRGWEVRLRGAPVAHGRVPDGRLLAPVGPAALPATVEGEPAEHPATGALASWVPVSARTPLEAAGLRLLDAGDCLQAALDASLREHAPALLGLDETQRLLDQAALRFPALVREVVPKRLDAPTLTAVLRLLAEEGVPLDLREVLDALAQPGEPPGSRHPTALAEKVRATLARKLTHRYAPSGRVEALVLEPETEDALRDALRPSPAGAELALEPDLAGALLESLRTAREAHPDAIVLAPADLRRHLRLLLATVEPRLTVLAWHELLAETEIERVGSLRVY